MRVAFADSQPSVFSQDSKMRRFRQDLSNSISASKTQVQEASAELVASTL